MNREVILTVSETDKNEVLMHKERLNGLNELAKCNHLPMVENIQDAIATESEIAQQKIKSWWEKTAKQYDFELKSDSYYEINFNTNEVIRIILKLPNTP